MFLKLCINALVAHKWLFPYTQSTYPEPSEYDESNKWSEGYGFPRDSEMVRHQLTRLWKGCMTQFGGSETGGRLDGELDRSRNLPTP